MGCRRVVDENGFGSGPPQADVREGEREQHAVEMERKLEAGRLGDCVDAESVANSVATRRPLSDASAPSAPSASPAIRGR